LPRDAAAGLVVPLVEVVARVLVGQLVGQEAHPSVEAPRPLGIIKPRGTLAPYVDDEPALAVATAEWPACIVGELNGDAVSSHDVRQVVRKLHKPPHASRELALEHSERPPIGGNRL